MKRTLITSAIIVGLSGCGSTPKGTTEFNTANQLASAQQYEEAIAYLQQALSMNPGNPQYTERLAQLRQKFLQTNLSKASALLSGNVTEAGLKEVEDIIAELRKAGIQSSEVNQLESLLQSKRTELYQYLESQYGTAKDAMERKDWLSAYRALSEISQRFTNYEDVQIRLNTVRSMANKDYLKQASSALKQDNFKQARAALNALQEIVPNNPIAKSMLSQIQKNDNSAYFLGKAQIAFDQQNWQDVITYCKRMTDYAQMDENCVKMMATAKQSQSDQISVAILESMSEGRLLESTEQFMQLKELNATSATKMDKLRSAISQQAAYSAQTYKQQGKYAMAWNLYKAINKVDPTYANLFNEIREVEDAIFDRSRRQIAVFDFNSPAESNDAGVIVANNLISRLFNNASNDITILERENLKSILEEMKLGQIGVVSESTAKEMGRVYGIDYAIMGSVLLYKVDENTANSTKTIRYQVGEKIEDNIDYLNWKAANPDPSRKELQSAPQAKIMVPEFGEKEYQVTQTKKVGFIQLSFRIVDVLTGENTRVDTIERKVQVEDTSNAGVKDAGIDFDPMEVPTDTEIMQQLTEDIVEHMAAEVLRPLQQLETFYFNQGKDRERRAELEQAVEYYSYAIFNEKLKSISSSPVTIEAQKRIDDILARYRFNTQ